MVRDEITQELTVWKQQKANFEDCNLGENWERGLVEETGK